MFKTFKTSMKFGSISAKWFRATNIDPGDKGQIARKASEYVNNLGLEAEDAWLLSLINWMKSMPWPDSQKMLARGLSNFIDQYEGKVALSATTIIAAREAASMILNNEK